MKSTLLNWRFSGFSSVLIMTIGLLFATEINAQEWSMAREWNEQVLFAITKDKGRPTIHSRNLYHTSAAMYDSWAAYEPTYDTWLLGKTRGGYFCAFEGVDIPTDPEELKAAREETMSFAVYRLVLHRFQDAPGFDLILNSINDFMDSHGYDRFNVSQDYINNGPAELGNYIANEIIAYGFQDGANEANGYANEFYEVENDTVFPQQPGNPDIINPNQWQVISLTNQIGQDGNPLSAAPPALSPEWGNMVPFSMSEDDMVTKQRSGHDWNIYHDPGPPPYLNPEDTTGFEDMYKWAFMMVSVWQSHNDPDDGVLWDISPASIGNVPSYPTTFEELDEFYDYFNGGETSQGWDINPKTGMPYEPQIVKRADYTRVLAEFWADGPDSYTPPGHWFEIVNRAVLDHPDFERTWMGEGEELDDLEYDVKLYFGLGGSVYDAAISAWSIKGYYDYIRPVSAIRYLCDQGQSTDPNLSNFSPAGVPLLPGYIEVVEEGDPLAGDMNEHVGKIKLYTWRGPDYIEYADTTNPFDPQDPINHAGVGWILGENWWPWQRPNFVSPPFPGYISGHSTFSSTAAEYMERVTGDAFFPGGMGEFEAVQDEFLHFEQGPSETITLQWATYRDASDQTSLSRIWGGIHPPVDDIAGRLIGMDIGEESVNHTNSYFDANRPYVTSLTAEPSVLNIDNIGENVTITIEFDRVMDTAVNPNIQFLQDNPLLASLLPVSQEWVSDQEYVLTYQLLDGSEKLGDIFVQVNDAEDIDGRTQNTHLTARPLLIDTDRPDITGISYNTTMLNDQVAEESWLVLTITVDEECDTTVVPDISFISGTDLSNTLNYISENSGWMDAFTYQATYSVDDLNEEVADIGVEITNTKDFAGNTQNEFTAEDQFSIDTRNPEFTDVLVNNDVLNIQAIGNNALQVTLEFDEPMNSALTPAFAFVNDNPLGTSLVHNSFSSTWIGNTTYQMSFNLLSTPAEYFDIVIELVDFRDVAGNNPAEIQLSNLFIIDTRRPEIENMTPSSVVVSDSDVGNGVYQLYIEYDEAMNTNQDPVVDLSADVDISGSIVFNPFGGSWDDDFNYTALFNVNDENIEVDDIDVEIGFGEDAAFNSQNALVTEDMIDLDTRNPQLLVLSANTYEVLASDVGDAGFNLLAVFDESMTNLEIPEYEFIGPVEIDNILSVNNTESSWINDFTYQKFYDVAFEEALIEDIGVLISAARDMAGNEVVNIEYEDYFSININTVGVADHNSDLGLSLFPNPVSPGESLSINVESALHDVQLHIITSAGKTVATKEFGVLESGVHNVSINHLSTGMYFVQIQSTEGVHTNRLVVLD